MKRGDMPAAPIERDLIMPEQGETLPGSYPYGMTIRERMAMAAMEGIISDPTVTISGAATAAVECADALLTELENTGANNE